MKKVSSFIISILFSASLSAQNCPPATAYGYLDINNVKARINNGGDMWWDLSNEAKYVVPKTGSVSSLFAGALWIGGIDEQGNLHVAAQTYRQNGNDFFAGPLDSAGNVTQQECNDFDEIWKVTKLTIDDFIQLVQSQGVPIPTNQISSGILNWPGMGNPYNPIVGNRDLAPFHDADGNNYYDPTQGDYPLIPGDQALWFVFNDKGNSHDETEGSPLGIEVQCLAYAFRAVGACTDNTTFYHYKIINKSANSYDSVYMGVWVDPDLGCYVDDYIGSDIANGLCIAYNATATDASQCANNYGADPPVIALQMLKGPRDDNGITHYLDHTMYYINQSGSQGNPGSPNDYYNYLRSVWKDGQHLTFGGTGHGGSTSTNYFYSGNPSVPNGWSMCAEQTFPGDMRFIISSGPISIQPGEIKTLDVAAVWDNTSVYPCPSFGVIDGVASCVKDYFDNNVVFSGTENISSSQQDVNVSPNPSFLSSIINFSGRNFSRVEIFDLAGKKFFDSEVKKNDVLKLNSDELGKGLFIYRITFSDHSSQSGKLVVQ